MKRKKVYMWYSTYKQGLQDYVEENLKEKEKDIFYMLWYSYGIHRLLKSCFFEMIRVGDRYHELQVFKYLNGQIKVLYITDPNANQFETFTKQ